MSVNHVHCPDSNPNHLLHQSCQLAERLLSRQQERVASASISIVNLISNSISPMYVVCVIFNFVYCILYVYHYHVMSCKHRHAVQTTATCRLLIFQLAIFEGCRQNAVSRLLGGLSRRDHVMQIFRDYLHWLPVVQWLQFKIGVLTLKALHGLAPHYLTEILPDCFKPDTVKESISRPRRSDCSTDSIKNVQLLCIRRRCTNAFDQCTVRSVSISIVDEVQI